MVPILSVVYFSREILLTKKGKRALLGDLEEGQLPHLPYLLLLTSPGKHKKTCPVAIVSVTNSFSEAREMNKFLIQQNETEPGVELSSSPSCKLWGYRG